jgi:hypothetical protein
VLRLLVHNSLSLLRNYTLNMHIRSTFSDPLHNGKRTQISGSVNESRCVLNDVNIPIPYILVSRVHIKCIQL